MHHTFNCQECRAGTSGLREVDTVYLSKENKHQSSIDDASKPGAFDHEKPKLASAPDSLLAEDDEARLSVNEYALNISIQVPAISTEQSPERKLPKGRNPSTVRGQLVQMQTMPVDSSYQLRSSTNTASQP